MLPSGPENEKQEMQGFDIYKVKFGLAMCPGVPGLDFKYYLEENRTT